MEVVLALQQAPVDGLDTRSPWERQEIANIFQFILPGASSKLMSIISGDVTQGSKVLAVSKQLSLSKTQHIVLFQLINSTLFLNLCLYDTKKKKSE